MKAFALLLIFCLVAQAHATTAPKPRVLLIGKSEYAAATNVTGGAIGGRNAVVGTASGTTIYTEHSETWEAMRRFSDECKGISLVTNPDQPHDYTIVMDYEKVSAGILGHIALYQLATLKPDGTPVLITKKNYLRRLVKPTCEAITKDTTNQ